MKHRIIQMIEASTGDYHYPVTLYEAIKDSVGTSLEDILRQKLMEFGLDYDEIVNKKIEDAEAYIVETLTEGDIKELREQITLINNKLSVRESQIAYLASNWISGLIPIELTDIYKETPRTLYISPADTPPEAAVLNDYWMADENHTSIKVKISEDTWISVSENTAIMLYGMTSSYAIERKQYRIESGTSDPTPSGINLDRVGDIYISVQDEITPYIWLGTLWSPLSYTPSVETGAKTSIDPIVDLLSVRYITVAYSTVSIDCDYRFTGTAWYSEYQMDDSLKRFLRSILPDDLSSYTTLIRKVYICPKKPTSATYKDAWISIRENRLYINESTDTKPIWVLQISEEGSVTDLKCTNLYAKTEKFDAFEDRELWMDIRTGEYSTLSHVEEVDNFGVQDLYGTNKSIGQKVKIKPNTVYTYSVFMKPKNAGQTPTIQFVADGCEIHNTSHLNGESLVADSDYVRVWMLFTTGPNVYESTCRIENRSGENILCYAPCLQEGFSSDWSPSLVDTSTGFSDALENKSSKSYVYREMSSIPVDKPASDPCLWVTDNGNTVKLYVRDHWEDISYDDYEGLKEAVINLYSVYASSGTTSVYTMHSAPPTPDGVGDFWIMDNLDVLRYTGSSWGSINGVLATNQEILTGRLQVSNDVLMQSLFLESSIDPDDLLDIARQTDPTVTLYKQGTEPTNPNTGDLWQNTITGIVLRYNGTAWTATGSAKVSNLEQTVDGLDTAVAEVYDAGSGRNYIQHSISMMFSQYVSPVYTNLDEDSKYVFSVQSSSIDGGLTQYTVRLMNEAHNIDYDNKVFTIGNTLNIWRFDTSVVPDGVKAHLVVSYGNSGSNLVLNKVQLEKGHLYTDWKAAIEDTDDSIASTNSGLYRVQNDLVSQSGEIDRISQDLIDAINISNEALARAVTVSQRADAFTVTATALTSSVDNMRVQLETYSSVFDFKPEGLQISSLINGIKSDISTYYRSNGMYFWSESAGSDVGYVTADGLNIRNARVQLGGILAMGNFQWKPRANGSLSLIYLEE